MLIIRQNKLFYTCTIVFLLAGGIFLSLYTKAETHLLFNEWHTSFGDFFFKYWTHVGDGLVLGIFAFLLLLFHSYYATLVATVSFLGTSVIAQSLKRLVFSDVLRPKAFFEGKATLTFVEGVEAHCCNSFPSGHTMAAFALFTLIALLVKDKRWGVIYFFAALAIGFSRIYLQQHFFVDVYVGATLGVFWVTLVYYFFERTQLNNRASWQKSLLSIKMK